MEQKVGSSLRERVISACEAVLARTGSVGPLELFQQIGWLQPVHVEGWRKGNEYYRALEKSIQVGSEKFQKTIQLFQEWVRERGLRPIEADYTRRGAKGIERLTVTEDGDPEREKFYRTHYVSPELSERKTARVAEKLKQAPELVVFIKVSEEGNCSECKRELCQGDFIFMEKGEPLCLACADLDRLTYLPAGDAALSRRARKYSSLNAVVVRFSRARKRYERQGLLVAEAALEQAEQECAADATERAAARVRAKAARTQEDREFIRSLTQAIVERYPSCPADEAKHIAEHTGLRSSGRVGRSAAGRELEAQAIDLAVRAHIRHVHTNYEELLMCGTDRTDARGLVREKLDKVLESWARKRGSEY